MQTYATEENMASLFGGVDEKKNAEMGLVLRKRHLRDGIKSGDFFNEFFMHLVCHELMN